MKYVLIPIILIGFLWIYFKVIPNVQDVGRYEEFATTSGTLETIQMYGDPGADAGGNYLEGSFRYTVAEKEYRATTLTVPAAT